jgi:hypothetical protein
MSPKSQLCWTLSSLVLLFSAVVLCCERRDPGGGPGAAPVDGDVECPGGNARDRWRAGTRGGAGGHREIHTGSILAENGQSWERDRGTRGRGSRHGRGGWQAGRGSAARDTAGSGNNGRGTGGQRSVIDNCVCVDCLFLRSPSRVCVDCLFKVTEPSSIPYRTHGFYLAVFVFENDNKSADHLRTNLKKASFSNWFVEMEFVFFRRDGPPKNRSKFFYKVNFLCFLDLARVGNCLLNSLRLSINRRGGSSPLSRIRRKTRRGEGTGLCAGAWSRDRCCAPLPVYPPTRWYQ